MSSKSNNLAEQNLIFAGLGLQLGVLSKDKVIRAFTEWLFDKAVPLGQILVQQKAITQEQRNTLESAVKVHIQQEGDQEKALASLHMVKDLESDLDHLADKDLMGTLDAAVSKRKSLGLDLLFSQSHGVDSKDGGFTFEGPSSNVKDRFERQQFLDSGNLGEVYFAKDTELNRLVVAKYIRPDRANENLTKALFHLEGEVTGSLEHPNIVPVYGLGKDTKGRLYYAMRYIRGRKLTRVIAEYHQIPKSESSKKHQALIGLLQYFQSACLAIEYAHSKGVLHCDIKPDNIMIGDYGEVFVVDWGLVVVQGEVKGSSDIHQMETMDPGVIPPYRPSEDASSGLHEQQGGSRKGVGGTPAYMAPEQFKATMEEDISLVSAKADIYALGATLYHLITGRAPHLPKGEGKESPDAFYFRITTGMIPKPKEIKPEVSNSLQGIVLKAMEVSPEDRYTSARELAEDIKRWVADEPVSAFKMHIFQRIFRFFKKNKSFFWNIVSLSLLIIIAIVILIPVLFINFLGKFKKDYYYLDSSDIKGWENNSIFLDHEIFMLRVHFGKKFETIHNHLRLGRILLLENNFNEALLHYKASLGHLNDIKGKWNKLPEILYPEALKLKIICDLMNPKTTPDVLSYNLNLITDLLNNKGESFSKHVFFNARIKSLFLNKDISFENISGCIYYRLGNYKNSYNSLNKNGLTTIEMGFLAMTQKKLDMNVEAQNSLKKFQSLLDLDESDQILIYKNFAEEVQAVVNGKLFQTK